MSEYITIVSYDDNGEDMPCAVCMRQRRDGKISICVGYTNDNARELNRIVTEQGYLKEHDAEIINKFAGKLKSRLGDALHTQDFEGMRNLIDEVAREINAR